MGSRPRVASRSVWSCPVLDRSVAQVLVTTGAIMAVCQLVLFPPLIKMLGIMTWQRLGCGLGIAAMVAFPGVAVLSWDHRSLVFLSVAVNTLANCSFGAVSSGSDNTRQIKKYPHTLTHVFYIGNRLLLVWVHLYRPRFGLISHTLRFCTGAAERRSCSILALLLVCFSTVPGKVFQYPNHEEKSVDCSVPIQPNPIQSTPQRVRRFLFKQRNALRV